LPKLLVDGISTVSARFEFAFTALPGPIALADPALTAQAFVQFTLNPDGSYTYDPSLASVFSVNGSVLVVNGDAVSIDSHLLSEAVTLDGSPLTGGMSNVELLPGSHTLADMLGNSIAFQVNPGDSVDYDHMYDQVLSGRGGPSLTLTGVKVTIDAHALTEATVGLDNFAIAFAAATPFPVVLLPGSHNLEEGADSGAPFRVNPDGTLGFDQQYDQIFSSQGATLTVNGAQVSFNAAGLTESNLELDPGEAIFGTTEFATTNSFTAVLLPGSHSLQEMGGGSVTFQVNPDDTFNYDSSLSTILSGAQSPSLVISGWAWISLPRVCPSRRYTSMAGKHVWTRRTA
jgi:hypothetical protein